MKYYILQAKTKSSDWDIKLEYGFTTKYLLKTEGYRADDTLVLMETFDNYSEALDRYLELQIKR